MSVNVLVLRAPGTNCDEETAYAFELCGAKTNRVHINRLLESPAPLAEAQILCLPGGFSYGDDIASGRILGTQFRRHLGEAMNEFKAKGKLILGICNGFQILMRSGLLLADDAEGQPATMDWNSSGRYQDMWTNLRVDPQSPCVFLKGIDRVTLPVAHAEGRFVSRNANVLNQLALNGQLALRYASTDEKSVKSPLDADLAWPTNPNGAQANVAGVCDPTGRVFGLMPHPERYIDRTHHPRWTRGEGTDPGEGLKIFQNAVDYFK